MDIIHNKRRLSTFQIIITGFAAVILVGSFFLMLPVATKGTGGASFPDALFTATSAVCVTGLIVHDTATYWSEFGQAVILVLIQIGGMGVVTVAVSIAMISGRKIGLMQRSTMQEAIAAHHMGGIVRLMNFIIKMTILFELIGAVVMAPVFCSRFGLGKGLWYAVFHSVSAFCNAGFDLMGVEEPFSSLTAYSSHPVMNLTVMALIVIGGIGFLTWDDMKENKLHFHKYRMQSKVILSVSFFLILFPTVYFFFCEFTTLPLGERIWVSLFQAVAPRTAGFNSVDLSMLSETGLAIVIILMLIGGSPGSTAGGMKTTTFLVFFSSAIAAFRRRDSANLFGRRVPPESMRNAGAIVLMYLVLFLSGGLIISKTEGLSLLSTLFETASAIGTVGLTYGITTQLGMLSRVILIVLMFFGRVGGLTLIFATIAGPKSHGSMLPKEKITVG